MPYGASISVSSNKVTINGTTVTATAATATTRYSYAFSSWSNATGTVTAARTITANFTRTERTVTISSIPTGVTVTYISGSSSYAANQVLTASSKLYYNDVIKVSYQTSNVAYEKTAFSVSGVSASSTSTSGSSSGYIQGKVTGTIGITFTQAEIVTAGLEFTAYGSGYAVTGYTGSSAVINVPSTYNGKPVIHIGSQVFKNTNDGGSSKVILPATITTYESDAFAKPHPQGGTTGFRPWELHFLGTMAQWCSMSCTGSSVFSASSPKGQYTYINGQEMSGDIVLPNDVTRINSWAFTAMWYVNTITIPSSVQVIEENAFYNCNVKNLIVNAKTISSNAFEYCSKLESAYISSNTTTINASSYSTSAFYRAASTAKIYCGASSKPSGWGTYWNYYNSSSTLTTNWGYTLSRYKSAVGIS